MNRENYGFAKLPREALLEMQDLEKRLKDETGKEVTLIAYTQGQEHDLDRTAMGANSDYECF
ncbi:hypothetical protein [Paenibacillus larvae]|uniref:Uncharacterized protein n=1 Tax=Paenibacillus larvae subsp. larvae TaxID=147375 RepID=A0A6C0QVM1_9BACL|nr:hypothetical protein [Paenibacillus larvae]QHZ52266.1 hypothetical protein ERICV_03152 [Paenibacillus larvae subsp. larvae]